MEAAFIPRSISAHLLEMADAYPVVTVTGPRQSGKTTLIRRLFPNLPYFSMEDPSLRELALSDPYAFLHRAGGEGMVLDEVQQCSSLLSYIQGLVDENPRLRFILSGSANFALLQRVTQSLAGRTAVLELLPLSYAELGARLNEMPLDDLLFRGFYPAAWSGRLRPATLYSHYVQTYLERDVRDLLSVKDLRAFRTFLRLCAARIGSLFNASEMSNEVGVSVNTIKSWLSVLEASYVVVLLSPYHANITRRLTKSPKLYFVDTGLACSLLDIESPKQLSRDKMRGHLFENFIIMEALKQRFNAGLANNLTFFRDSNGVEVDLVTKRKGMLQLTEIKSAITYNSDFEKGIRAFCHDFGDIVERSDIVYAGDIERNSSNISLLNYKTWCMSGTD